MTAPRKPRAPKGWRIVTRGKVREGDLLLDFIGWNPHYASKYRGQYVGGFTRVARRVRRAGLKRIAAIRKGG